MHLIATVEWDCDGMKPVEDCNLPLKVLVLNAPDEWKDDEYQEALSDALSEVYGFCHDGFTLEPINPDGKRSDDNYRQPAPWSTLIDAVMEV